MIVVTRDEDWSVPQTGAGQRFLAGASPELSDGALVVLADVVALLGDAQDTLDEPRDLALYVVEHVRSLYGVRPLQVVTPAA